MASKVLKLLTLITLNIQTMLKTLSRKAISAIHSEAHQVVYRTMGELFGQQHSFKQGRCHRTVDQGLYIINGYSLPDEDFIPIAEMVVGSRIRNKSKLPQVSALSVKRLLRQTFAGNKAWVTDDFQVKTKQLLEPIANFIAKYADYFDVFAGVYENVYTHTNVFGLVVLLKDVEGPNQLAWEITIDDADLEQPDTVGSVFR